MKQSSCEHTWIDISDELEAKNAVETGAVKNVEQCKDCNDMRINIDDLIYTVSEMTDVEIDYIKYRLKKFKWSSFVTIT